MSSTEPKVTSVRMPDNYQKAIQKLRLAQYGMDNSLTVTSVILAAIREAWEKEFPGEPFPEEPQS